VEVFLLLLIAIISFDKLHYPGVWEISFYKLTLRQVIDGASSAALIVAFIWLLLRLIDFIALLLEERANLTQDQNDNQLIVFFKDFFKVILILIGLLLLLRFAFNKSIGNLFTGLSIVGAALALATRESLENLIASFIIFFDKPFVTGDLVKVEGFTGNVERIGLRSTRVRTEQKTYITIPNKKMVDTILDNITMRTQRKVEIRLDVNLTTTRGQIQELITAAKHILKKEGIEDTSVFLSDIGRNALTIAIDYFTTTLQSANDFNMLRQQVNLELITTMEDLSVGLAGESTNVTLRQTE
jgi:MscS family membrane protein